MAKPKITIVKGSAKSAIKMWHDQYGFASRKLADGTDSGEISKRLRDLKRPTRTQVDSIIGHDGWTNLFCDCCHEHKRAVAAFGTSNSTYVCTECLNIAFRRVRKAAAVR